MKTHKTLILKNIFLFILLLIFNSCASVKNSESKISSEKITSQNFKTILGKYKNSPINIDGNLLQNVSLWNNLNYNEKKEYPNWKDLEVVLYTKDEQVYAELKGEQVYATKKLKGKIHNGYYLLNHQYKFKTFYLLINGVGNSSVKLTTHNNNLVLLEEIGGIGLIIIFPGFGSGGHLREYEYERIN